MQFRLNATYTLAILFLLSLTVALLHQAAFAYYWYWRLWWFDIVMHFLGGIVVALIAHWIYLKREKIAQTLSYATYIIVSVVFVALLWEVYEYIAGIPIAGRYAIDTATDVLLAFIAGLLFVATIKRNDTQ